jgi:hypothetical protein
MMDLLEALRCKGWEVSGGEDLSCRSPLFLLNNEVVQWKLHRGLDEWIDLEFHAFGDFGEPTSSLDDILYCVVLGTDYKLYFSKRTQPRWLNDVDIFVNNVPPLSDRGMG